MMNDQIGPAPVALRVAVTPAAGFSEGGQMGSVTQIETYVLLSSLPQELQERVRTAVQALITGR